MTFTSVLRPNDYHFRTQWHVRAPYDVVFETLADLEHYPQWWPAVRRIVPVDEQTATVYLRSRLPYTLECTVTRTDQDLGRGLLQVALGGDLRGFASWTVTAPTASTPCTTAEYEQRVRTVRMSMRLLAPVAHPLFALNHRWMMQAGQLGLRRGLDR